MLSKDAAAHVAEVADRDRPLMERHRRLTDGVAQALADAGFVRHFVPRRFGGCEGTFTALFKATAALGETSPAAAWCAGLYAVHGWLASHLPEAAQHELWQASPDTRIAAVVPVGASTAAAVPGGWRLTGRWQFASGVDHADWVVLAARTGQDNQEHRLFAIPRGQVTIRDTWHPLGMQGTGSNTVEVTDVGVPEHRTCTMADMLRPREGVARCYQVPFAMVGPLLLASPILGAARGALAAWVMAHRSEKDGARAMPNSHAQVVMGRAAAQIRAAGLLLSEGTERADRATVTNLLVAESHRDAAVAVELCTEAVDRLFRALRAYGQVVDDPVQRHWRDITTAATHTALSLETASTVYAAAVFG
ncbi:acyl-CoA dehydrogenase family protein [Streptomyces misionensis]|uniref:acyl-CoA dehydrogenase family protein n=1 Tax=Streptomyces misionensis TaxID=67331 RepID=UPI0036C4A6F8